MNKTIGKSVLILAVASVQAFWIVGCHKGQSKTAAKTPVVKDIRPVKVGGVYDDIARFIAGMPVDSASALYPLTKTPAWIKYHASTDSNWAQFQQTLIRIYEWRDSELKDRHVVGNVFYPFSGPDFLYVYSFFPDADRYTLIGLEPVGVVPDPLHVPANLLDLMFSKLDRNIEYALKLTFFKTRNMRTDLAGKTIEGTLPILLYFTARTGNQISSVKPLKIDRAGSIFYCDEFEASYGKRVFSRGVEIRFHKNEGSKEQTLVYFSEDISNGGLSTSNKFRKLLENLPRQQATYIKAASYLMYQNSFSLIRKAILSKSECILQDDSGIPYRYFNPSKWSVQLYGKYTKPYYIFKEFLDEGLKKAYADRNTKPLSFRCGYQDVPNLLLAFKKEP